MSTLAKQIAEVAKAKKAGPESAPSTAADTIAPTDSDSLGGSELVDVLTGGGQGGRRRSSGGSDGSPSAT